MTALVTTLSAIKAQSPCPSGWRILLTALGPDYGDDIPLPLARIVKTNGVADALWALHCFSAETMRHVAVTFACDCAERVLPIWERRYPLDQRPHAAIRAGRACVSTPPTVADAYRTALTAASTHAAAEGADAADRAPCSAAHAAAYGADTGAYYDHDTMTYNAYAGAEAAEAASTAALGGGERTWQKQHLIELLENAP